MAKPTTKTNWTAGQFLRLRAVGFRQHGRWIKVAKRRTECGLSRIPAFLSPSADDRLGTKYDPEPAGRECLKRSVGKVCHWSKPMVRFWCFLSRKGVFPWWPVVFSDIVCEAVFCLSVSAFRRNYGPMIKNNGLLKNPPFARPACACIQG